VIKDPCQRCNASDWSNKKAGFVDGVFTDLYCDRCAGIASFVSPEWIPDRIREERVKYAKDIVQPWRNGQLSKEYIEHNGTKGIKVTPEQIKNAKYVWKGDVPGL
jgi:hypothetical protein